MTTFSVATGEELFDALVEAGIDFGTPHASNDWTLATTSDITNGFASMAAVSQSYRKAYPLLMSRDELIELKVRCDMMIATLDAEK